MTDPFTFDRLRDRYTLDRRRVVFVEMATDDLSSIYTCFVDGVRLGEVRKVRYSAAGVQGRKGNRSGWGHGHWGWEADGAPEIDYPTRSNAVAEAIRAMQRRGAVG